MDQHEASTLPTAEADDDEDSSSAYGRTIKSIMQKTRAMPEFEMGVPHLAQLSDAIFSSSHSSEANFDGRASVFASELNNDTSSQRCSIIMQPDYECRSLYSISEYEADVPPSPISIGAQQRFSYIPYSPTSGEIGHQFGQYNANHRLLHNQFETSFTNSIATQNDNEFLISASELAALANNGPPLQQADRLDRMKSICLVKKHSLIEKLSRTRSMKQFENYNHQQPGSPAIMQLRSVLQPHRGSLASSNSNNSEYLASQIMAGNNNNNNNNNNHYPYYNSTTNQSNAHSRYASMAASSEETGTESFDDPDLHTKWSWRNLRREFKLSHSESLFHLYQAKLQQSFFVALLILNIIFNLGAVVSYGLSKYHQMNIYLIIMRFASIWVMISFLILIWYNKDWLQSKFSRTVAALAVLMAMIFGEASGAICALMNDQATPLASIRRTYYLIITNHVFLPFPTRIQACAATIIITSFEIVVTYISRRDNNCRADYLTLYSIADIIFYASSAMIGFQITFLLEIAIRRTFLNHKYCIQSTYKLNYEKEQQEQLLRSCFPQHLIEQVRNDIRQSIAIISKRQSQPFRPFYNLYVKKYEDVTILYADIVNSMNLTDKLNPAELVETLNELYGRFDELAEKYNCLRIKLLGDCYYCVSGLPEYDDDHAMKCLLMGLGMIKIIQSIRQSRNVDIDMRIGIHSGSVLSGLLGLRKWQFDIWSFDAMKASLMEHSGQPGFVHITQRTLDLISQDHSRRQDLIITATRQSDDSETTYLISERLRSYGQQECSAGGVNKRIGQSEKLKAYIEKLRVRPTTSAMDFTQRRMALESSLKKYREIHEKVDETMKSAIADMPLGSAWKQFFFFDCLGLGALLGRTRCESEIGHGGRRHDQHGDTNNNQAGFGGGGEVRTAGQAPRGSISITIDNAGGREARQDYVSQQKGSDCSKGAEATQRRSQASSAGLSRRKFRSVKKAAAAAAATTTTTSTTKTKRQQNDLLAAAKPKVRSPYNKALIQTDPLFHLYLICVGLITLSILAIKCLIPGMPIYSHTVIGFAFLLAIILVSTIYTQVKTKKINLQFRILLWFIISASLTMLQLVDLIVPDELDSLNVDSIADISRADSLSCAFAWYYTFTIIVAMTATSIFIRINVWLKFMIHMSTIIFYIVINNPPATMLETLKEFLETQSNNWSLLDHKQELSHLFYISMIAVLLHLIDRQVEYILSLNLQWNEQIEHDRVESETVGEINRILLENILPPHVLKRYLYNTTVSYDQLYHESHPSCAVMFASIPNYESFYTENSLNEQGLRCLQVLNEIICDFDQLLSHPGFRKIEKIKTIGSTYMAACFDVNRRTSDCTLDGPETPHTPDIGLKTGWSNPLMSDAASQSACSSPRVLSSGKAQSIRGGTRNQTSRDSMHLDELAINNVVTMVCFATALMENLARMNKDAWQEFRLRIGIAIGPVIAGVVGASKPTYDIWGDTVNVASRLESSGILGRIQVTEQVAQILTKNGQFDVECRGPIEVKGKGRLTTYLVVTPYDSPPESPGRSDRERADGRAMEAEVNSQGELEEIIEAPPELADDDGVEELGSDAQRL